MIILLHKYLDMWIFLCVVYISLLLVNKVEPHETQDGAVTEGETKAPRHHRHHHRPRSPSSDAAKKTTDDDLEANATTEEPIIYIEETTEMLLDNINSLIEKTETNNTLVDDVEDNVMVNDTEDNSGKTRDILTLDTFGKVEINTDDSSSSDYSESGDTDKQSYMIDNDDNRDTHDDDIEVLHHPYRKSLSQDPVLDVKARSGFVQMEVNNTNDYSRTLDFSKIERLAQQLTNLRSGYAAPIELENVSKAPEYQQNNIHHFNRPYQQSNVRLSQFKPTPDVYYNALISSPQYHPLLNDNSGSPEVYPKLNDMWGQGGTVLQTKSYFGSNNPYTYRGCLKCGQGRISPREASLVQSESETNVLETANGRTVQFDPSSSNAYPLAREEDENGKDSTVYTQDHTIKEVGRNGRINRLPEVVPLPKVLLSNAQSDVSPMSKVIATRPSYVSRSSTLLRHIALGGVSRMVV